MKIAAKLVSGFSLVALIFLIAGGMGLWGGNKTMTFVAFTIATLLAISLGFLLAHRIQKSLQPLMAATKKLSLGDVNVTVELQGRDEVGIWLNRLGQWWIKLGRPFPQQK